MKSILIGSVGSSRTMLEEMVNNDFPLNFVFSLDEKYSVNVSGYYPLHELAEKYNIPYQKFKKINEPENISTIKKNNPDYIFVIGLSQLIGKEIIGAAKIGVIGFHPAPLPKFRGRAVKVWKVLLGVKETKNTLFFLDEGIDSGDIIDQEPYIIEDNDYQADIGIKSKKASIRLFKRVLHQIKKGTVKAYKQNENEATYTLKRNPEDGLINWQQPAEKIQRLIRAVSKPYPGAFSYYVGKYKVVFWRADYFENEKYIGVSGQIAKKTDTFIDIVCKEGMLRVYEYEKRDGVQLIEGNKFK